jgi:hypothetical protein
MKKTTLLFALAISLSSSSQVYVKENPVRQRTVDCASGYQAIMSARKEGYDSVYILTYEDADYKYKVSITGRKSKEDFLRILKRAAFATDFVVFESDGVEYWAKGFLSKGVRYIFLMQSGHDEGGYASIPYSRVDHLFFK